MAFPLWFGSSSEDGGRHDVPSGQRPRLVRLESPNLAEEHVLLARLRSGDAQALRIIVDAHGPALLTLAGAVTGSAELGDDVVQHVFIRLWDGREKLVVEGALRQYLWRATRNQAISVRRHERLQQRIAYESQFGQSTVQVARNWGEESLDAASVLVQVTAVLQELPARCREIFLLNWRDAQTPAEIAESLGIGVASVRNQILRAVKHLATHLRR